MRVIIKEMASPHVVAPLEAWGGLSDIVLTHRDDVADAGRYAEHFGARVWIHEADRAAAPFATHICAVTTPLRSLRRLLDSALRVGAPGSRCL